MWHKAMLGLHVNDEANVVFSIYYICFTVGILSLESFSIFLASMLNLCLSLLFILSSFIALFTLILLIL